MELASGLASDSRGAFGFIKGFPQVCYAPQLPHCSWGSGCKPMGSQFLCSTPATSPESPVTVCSGSFTASQDPAQKCRLFCEHSLHSLAGGYGQPNKHPPLGSWGSRAREAKEGRARPPWPAAGASQCDQGRGPTLCQVS